MFRRAKRYKFTDTLYDFNGLLRHHDHKLFDKMQLSSHCLNHILPLARPVNRPVRNKSLSHSLILPKTRTELYRKSFVPRVLYDFTYYSSQ